MALDKHEFSQLKQFLDEEARRINTTDFIANDPVQFPRQFSRLQDIELIAILSATIAWGNRKMICNNCRKIIELMDAQPYDFVMDGTYEQLPDINIHRTFFAKNMRYMLRGFHSIFKRYGSLHQMALHHHIGDSEAPAWLLVQHMQQEFMQANGGVTDSRCLPGKLDTTALKRINMALRWLVRDDGIVDLGVWDAIKPSQLFIPLDVHVGDTARALRLTERRANDRRTVVEITDVLRQMRPNDPVIYDYALFGIGIGEKYLHPINE
ncbi:MAG: TIGR02757 family protein [Muribaculaceae bacterium]